MAAMAMTELLGGPISPCKQSVVKLDRTMKGDSPTEGPECTLKKRKLEDTTGTHSVGKTVSANSTISEAHPTVIASTDAGRNKCILYKKESAFQMVGGVTSVKPSDRPLVRDTSA